MYSAGMDTPSKQVADALGLLSQRSLRRRMYAHLTQGLGEEINESTYLVLSGLDRCGPSTPKELATVIGLDRSVVSRHASALEKAGLIARATDPRDARWIQLSLTPLGQDNVAVMRSRLTQKLEEFLAHWPEPAQQQFAEMLTDLTNDGPFAH